MTKNHVLCDDDDKRIEDKDSNNITIHNNKSIPPEDLEALKNISVKELTEIYEQMSNHNNSRNYELRIKQELQQCDLSLVGSDIDNKIALIEEENNNLNKNNNVSIVHTSILTAKELQVLYSDSIEKRNEQIDETLPTNDSYEVSKEDYEECTSQYQFRDDHVSTQEEISIEDRLRYQENIIQVQPEKKKATSISSIGKLDSFKRRAKPVSMQPKTSGTTLANKRKHKPKMKRKQNTESVMHRNIPSCSENISVIYLRQKRKYLQEQQQKQKEQQQQQQLSQHIHRSSPHLLRTPRRSPNNNISTSVTYSAHHYSPGSTGSHSRQKCSHETYYTMDDKSSNQIKREKLIKYLHESEQRLIKQMEEFEKRWQQFEKKRYNL